MFTSSDLAVVCDNDYRIYFAPLPQNQTDVARSHSVSTDTEAVHLVIDNSGTREPKAPAGPTLYYPDTTFDSEGEYSGMAGISNASQPGL